MSDLGLRVRDVSMHTGIAERKLSDYLANRHPIGPRHRQLLADLLDMEPAELTPPATPDDTDDDSDW